MSTENFATIKLRQDTTTNWNARTIPLFPGEPGFDSTTGALKCGDGSSLWPDLPDIRKQFPNVVTVAKTGKPGSADFICSKYTNDTTCIQAALDKISSLGGGHLHILSGNYSCSSSTLSYAKGNIIISGDGDSTILDFSSNPSCTGYLTICGALTTTTSPLSASVSAGAKTITVTDGTLFSAGDWIQIRSEAIFQPRVDAIDSYVQKMGEIQHIESVNGNDITLSELILGSYNTTDSALVTKVSMLENVTIQNFKILGNPNTGNMGIICSQIYNLNVSHISTVNARLMAISGRDIIIGNYTNNNMTKSSYAGYGYGIAILDSSRETYIAGNHFFDCRHGVTTGGQPYGIQYNTVIIGNTQNYDALTVGMFGPHPAYDGLIIANNICSGCSLGFFNGKNTIVIGNRVYNTDPNGSSGLSIVQSCDNILITNNIIECHRSNGIKIISQYDTIKITNNIINVSGTFGDAYGIFFTDVSTNLEIDSNTINSEMSPIIFTNTNATALSNNIKIKNNTVTCTGAYVVIDIIAVDYPINNIEIIGNTVKSIQSGIGIRVTKTNTTGGINSNVIITNNKCMDNSYGITTTNSEKITIDNNKIYNATKGIYIGSGSTGYSILNNNLNNCTTGIGDTIKETSRIVCDNPGFNPAGNFTAPTLPVSTGAYTNNYGYPCRVTISGGTVTNITLDGVATGLTSGSFVIPIGGTIAITYSSAPVWKWWGL